MNKATEWWQRLTAHAYFPILILLVANLVIGALLVADYGESRDEIFRYRTPETLWQPTAAAAPTLRTRRAPST